MANGDLVLGTSAGDTITIQGQYTNPNNQIEEIDFADGTTIGLEHSELAALSVSPLSGTHCMSAVLVGTDFDDHRALPAMM